MHIFDLPRELLERVFLICSVEDVLSLTLTCKTSADICQSRRFWTSLLMTLDDESTPNLPPHIPLSTLSTAQLRSKVVEASRRKLIYAQACPPLPFTQTSLLDLPPESNATVIPQLLPGGRHSFVEVRGRIQLWDLKTQSRLYEAPSEEELDYCATYTFDLVGSGEQFEVLFAVLYIKENASAYVRVFSYKFAVGLGRILIQRNLSVNFLWRPMLSGSLLILHNTSLLNVLLIDCETQAATIIDFSPITRRRGNSRVAVVEKKHLLATIVVDSSYMVASIPLSSLKGRWSRSPAHTDWPSLTFVEPGTGSGFAGKPSENEITGKLKYLWDYNASSSPWAVKVKVLLPTWRYSSKNENTDSIPAEIIILMFSLSTSRPHPKKLISTKLRLTATSEEGQEELMLIAQRTCEVEHIPWTAITITNSGRMFFLRDRSLFCSRLESEDMQPRGILDMSKEMANGATLFDVEPWSETFLVGFLGRLSALKLRLRPDHNMKTVLSL